jgi:hypothetical protein
MAIPVGYTTEAPLPSSGPVDDRALHAFRELVRAVLPQLALLGVWEYRVEVGGTSSVTCSPVDPSLGLPGGVVAQIWPSVLGEQVTIAPGQRVLIAFVNGDPARAVALAGDPSTRPTAAALLGPGSAAARVGDAVAAGTLAWASAGGGTIAVTYAPASGPPLVLTLTGTASGPPLVPVNGSVTSGSAKVTIG